jgi:hypothetical protein
VGDTSIQADAWNHHAHAVGAENAQPVSARLFTKVLRLAAAVRRSEFRLVRQ